VGCFLLDFDVRRCAQNSWLSFHKSQQLSKARIALVEASSVASSKSRPISTLCSLSSSEIWRLRCVVGFLVDFDFHLSPFRTEFLGALRQAALSPQIVARKHVEWDPWAPTDQAGNGGSNGANFPSIGRLKRPRSAAWHPKQPTAAHPRGSTCCSSGKRVAANVETTTADHATTPPKHCPPDASQVQWVQQREKRENAFTVSSEPTQHSFFSNNCHVETET